MTQTAHTPTPWTRATLKNHEGLDVHVIVCKGEVIVECSKENAAFIVKACNAHDELVEALTDLMRARVRDNEVGPVTAKARAILAKVQS